VGTTTIGRAERVVRDTPELAAQVKAGDITLGYADNKRSEIMADRPVKRTTSHRERKAVENLLAQLSGVTHAVEVINPDVWEDDQVHEFDMMLRALNSFRRKLKA